MFKYSLIYLLLIMEKYKKDIEVLKEQVLTNQRAIVSMIKYNSKLKEETNIWIKNYNTDLKELKEQVDAESNNSDVNLAFLRDLETLYNNHKHGVDLQ